MSVVGIEGPVQNKSHRAALVWTAQVPLVVQEIDPIPRAAAGSAFLAQQIVPEENALPALITASGLSLLRIAKCVRGHRQEQNLEIVLGGELDGRPNVFPDGVADTIVAAGVVTRQLLPADAFPAVDFAKERENASLCRSCSWGKD